MRFIEFCSLLYLSWQTLFMFAVDLNRNAARPTFRKTADSPEAKHLLLHAPPKPASGQPLTKCSLGSGEAWR